jgi:hypothetical protein
MSVRKYVVTVFALCLLFSIALLARSARNAHDPAVEDDIREAVLRYQMADWGKGDKAMKEAADQSDKAVADALNFKLLFISINGEDPSDAFMTRFEKFPIPVKKLSQSGTDKKPIYAVVDKTTGERGIIFRVEKIKWLGSNFVEAEGGYVCGGLCASGQTFKVHRKHGAWEVIGSTVHWNS